MSKLPPTSFILPCLNEEGSLASTLAAIHQVGARDFQAYEALVVDNGSTDQSASVAKENGARVIVCEQKGYGAALLAGIAAASHELVIYADADGTYDFQESSQLVTKLQEDVDLVIGSRFSGRIEKNAMPFLHRYLGTPVLTSFINFLHAPGSSHLTDCNSGFRTFRREKILNLHLQSKGMEFSSEMLVKGLRQGMRILEVPITLRASDPSRTPHLHTWRDGMRHLIQIFLACPEFFRILGLVVFILAWIALSIAAFNGPTPLFGLSLFGLHTMLFAFLLSQGGITLWGMGLALATRNGHENSAYARLVHIDEGKLFWLLCFLASFAASLLFGLILRWRSMDYQFLDLEALTILLVCLSTNILSLIAHFFLAHMLKRN